MHWVITESLGPGDPLKVATLCLCVPNPTWQRIEPLCALIGLIATEKRPLTANVFREVVQVVTRWRNIRGGDVCGAKLFNMTEKFALEPAPHTFCRYLQRLESTSGVSLASDRQIERLPHRRRRFDVPHDAASAVDFLDFDGVHVIECLDAALFKLQEANDALGKRLRTVLLQGPH